MTLAVAMVACTDEARGSSPIVIVPVTSLNDPRTLLTIRWRATKPTVVCEGSSVKVPAVGM